MPFIFIPDKKHMARHPRIIPRSSTTIKVATPSLATPSLASRLPGDVILEIVQHVLDAYFLKVNAFPDQPSAETEFPHVLGGPWTYAQLNRAWRQAVVHAPSLWRRIDISHEATELMVSPHRLLELMIERSNEMPLRFRYSSISYTTMMIVDSYPVPNAYYLYAPELVPAPVLESASSTDIALLRILMVSSARWQTADIATDLTMVEHLNAVHGKIGELESLILGGLEGENTETDSSSLELVAFSVAPKLRHLGLPDHLATSTSPTMFPWGGLTQYQGMQFFADRQLADLHAMSNLVECSVSSPEQILAPDSEIVLLANLVTLKINNMGLLAMIRAPALKHLDITGASILFFGSTPLSSFIEGSACNLESIRMSCVWCFEAGVKRALRELRSLELVHLIDIDSDLLTFLLFIPGHKSSAFPPSLKRLVIATRELLSIGEHSLAELLKRFDISLLQPAVTWDPKCPLLEITFSAPAGDLGGTTRQSQDEDSETFGGEARMVSHDDASPPDLLRNPEWPAFLDGFWGGGLYY